MAQRTTCRRPPVLRRRSGRSALRSVPTRKCWSVSCGAWIRAGICYRRVSASRRPRRIASGTSITPAGRTHSSATRGRTSPRLRRTPRLRPSPTPSGSSTTTWRGLPGSVSRSGWRAMGGAGMARCARSVARAAGKAAGSLSAAGRVTQPPGVHLMGRSHPCQTV